MKYNKEIVDEIYDLVHSDYEWSICVRDCIESRSFKPLIDQYTLRSEVSHNWHLISKENNPNLIPCTFYPATTNYSIGSGHVVDREEISQRKDWRYDESFVFR